jgi:hypothetical protein
MNFGGFSWRRLLGVSTFKSRLSRLIGIPLTASGRRRKLGASVFNAVGPVVGALVVAAIAGEQHRESNQHAVSSGPLLGYGIRCYGCEGVAIYPTKEAAMTHTSTGMHFSEYDRLIPQGRIRFVGWGKFEHKCTDFPFGSSKR